MSPCRVAAVILAGGASARLGGSPKALLPYAGRTIVETVIAKAGEAGLNPLVVVVGSEGDAVRDTLERSAAVPHQVVVNPFSAAGITGSVAVGVRVAMTEDVDAVAVLLGDEPGIEVDSIHYVVGDWCRTRSAAVRALYEDRPGHPVILSRSVLALVAGLPPSASVLSELARADHEVGTVVLASLAPIDVDTAEDYERALRRSWQAPPVLAGTIPVAAEPLESRRP
jgi:CTP:molybdopterin cytidylyltransferase MocA